MDAQAIYDIWTGAFGDGIGGLASTMITAATVAIRKRFERDPVEKALYTALEEALLEAAEKALRSDQAGVTDYYIQCVATYLRRPAVQAQLAILLEPHSLALDEAAAIVDTQRAHFTQVANGYLPEQIPDLDFEHYLTTLFGAFYRAAERQPTLQPIIELRLLSRMCTELNSVLLASTRIAHDTKRGADSAELIAGYTEPLADKLDALHQELRWMRQEGSTNRILADEAKQAQ